MFDAVMNKLQDDNFIQQSLSLTSKESPEPTPPEWGTNVDTNISSLALAGMSDEDTECYAKHFIDTQPEGARGNYINIGRI